MSRTNLNQPNLGPQLIAGGSAVILISVFLSWVSYSGPTKSVSQSLWKFNPGGGHRATGLLLLLAVVALVLAAMFLFQGQARVLSALGGTGLLLGGAAIVLAAQFLGASTSVPLGGAGGQFTGGGELKISGAYGSYLAALAGLAVAFGAWRTLAIDNSAFGGIAGAMREAAAGVRSVAAGARAANPGGAGAAGSTQGPAGTPRPAGEAEQAPAAEQARGSVAPGWYPDPSGEHGERFWDGTAWTHQTR